MRPPLNALADIANFDIASGQGTNFGSHVSTNASRPRPVRQARMRREGPANTGGVSTRPRRRGRIRTEDPIGNGNPTEQQYQQQPHSSQHSHQPIRRGPPKPNIPHTSQRFTLYVRQPARLCKLTKPALELAQQLPNLPPIDVIHLPFWNVNHPHVKNTPVLADNKIFKRYRGIHALKWLQEASQQGTKKAEQESRKRVKQNQKTSHASGGPTINGGRMRKQKGNPKPPPPKSTGFITTEEINASENRRKTMLAKIQDESDGINELPAPKPPI